MKNILFIIFFTPCILSAQIDYFLEYYIEEECGGPIDGNIDVGCASSITYLEITDNNWGLDNDWINAMWGQLNVYLPNLETIEFTGYWYIDGTINLHGSYVKNLIVDNWNNVWSISLNDNVNSFIADCSQGNGCFQLNIEYVLNNSPNLEELTLKNLYFPVGMDVCSSDSLKSLTLLNLDEYSSSYSFSSLDLNQFPHLERLDIEQCQSCSYGNLQINNIDNLTHLKVNSPSLSFLDPSNASNLLDLNLKGAILSSIYLSNCTLLEKLSLENVNLTTIYLNGANALKELNLVNTHLNSIDLSTNFLLNRFVCQDNTLLNAINLNAANSLQCAYLINNDNMLAFDFNLYSTLDSLNIEDNALLQSINLNGADSLFLFSCKNNNQLTNIDLSTNSLLNTFYCNDNFSLSNINLNGAEALEVFHLINNDNISVVDLSANSSLYSIECQSNSSLSVLDLSDNMVINTLVCSGNNLHTLNIENCIELETLSCAHNNLDSLNLVTNSDLEHLDASNNNLTSLDLKNNISLMSLLVNNNQLQEVDLRNGNNMNIGSSISDINLSNNSQLHCVSVDNVGYSVAYWTFQGGNIDPWTYFNSNCNPAFGCTDPLADNYDPVADTDDGSCIYSSGCLEDPMTGLFIDGIIDDRVNANFDNMNTYDANGNQVCRVDQIRIQYRPVGTNSWSQKNIASPVGYDVTTGICNSTQSTMKPIRNLTLSTEYEWKVKVWYCSGGNGGWVDGPNFTTADECPNVGNLTAYGANPTKATFTWDNSNGPYELARIKMRIDTISNPSSSDWFLVGGFGVQYGTYTKDKNGLIPGETYRGQARTFCDPNGGAYNSLSWSPLATWTQPTNRINGGEAISNLDAYPNPSKDVFNITFTSEQVQDLKVRVLNVVGEEIVSEDLQQFVGEYTKKINLQDYAKGIYFLEIVTNQGLNNKKLILQ